MKFSLLFIFFSFVSILGCSESGPKELLKPDPTVPDTTQPDKPVIDPVVVFI